MDKQSLHETAKRLALEYPLSSFAGLLARSSMFLKLAQDFYAVVGATRRPLYQSEVRPQKSLLNQQIYPSIKPGYHRIKSTGFRCIPARKSPKRYFRSDQRFVESGG